MVHRFQLETSTYSGANIRLTGSSDVLVQHQKKCEKFLQRPEIVRSKETGKQFRTRRACDQCAQSKAKCDTKEPCGRCRSRSIACSHTRRGPRGIELSYGRRYQESAAAFGFGPSSSTPGSPYGDGRGDEVRDLFLVSPDDVDIGPAGSSNIQDHRGGSLLQQSESLQMSSGYGDEFYGSFTLPEHRRIFDLGIGSLSDDLDFGPMLDPCLDLDSLPFYLDRTGSYESLHLSQPQSTLSHGKPLSLYSWSTSKITLE